MKVSNKISGDIVGLKSVKPCPDGYDTVFLGFPSWWGTIPMAYYTLLEKYDPGSRTVIPFVPHGGSAFGSSIQDLKRLCPKAQFREWLAVCGSRVMSAQKDADKWLARLGLASE